MSKKTTKKKKVVVTTTKKTASAKIPPTVSKSRTTVPQPRSGRSLIYDRQNYLWMGIGVLLIVLGLLLMLGGSMPDPNTWDADLIYSFRRTGLAPILILAGLVIEIYAIFKR